MAGMAHSINPNADNKYTNLFQHQMLLNHGMRDNIGHRRANTHHSWYNRVVMSKMIWFSFYTYEGNCVQVPLQQYNIQHNCDAEETHSPLSYRIVL